MTKIETYLIATARQKMTECEVEHAQLTDAEILASKITDLRLDSLRFLELIMSAEQEFTVEIDEDDITQNLTLAGLGVLATSTE